jgi:hypothetical protein
MAIRKFKASMEKSDQHIHDIERGHNLRYFGFLFVAILAGGKLANASRAMVKHELVRPKSWLLTIIYYLSKKIIIFFVFLINLGAFACRHFAKEPLHKS